MVKLLLCLPLLLLGPDTELLVTAPGCPACKKAEVIIKTLQTDGYDVTIVSSKDHPVSVVPTLLIRTGGKVLSRVKGLQSEQKYRFLITKTINDFTGTINFTIGTEPRTLLYAGIIRRAQRSRYDYLEYNPDSQPELIRQFSINMLPTLLILKNGKELGRYIGVTPYNKVTFNITAEIK